MPPPSTELSSNLREEALRCKNSLKHFTSTIIESLNITGANAERLRKYDNSRREENVYLCFPFCFREAFTDVSIEDVRTITLSAVLWMSYMRAQDDTIDILGTVDPQFLFLRDLYLRESLHLLYKLFPHNSRFWELYSNYFDEYARAVLCEHNNHSTIESHYEDEEFHTIAKGKAAMAKYTVAAQAVLSEQYEKLPLLAESLDCFHVGYQYWDDLVDWRDDITNSKYSLLVAKALGHKSLTERSVGSDTLCEHIGRVVHYSGLADEHLDRSFQWLERAYELSLAADCKVWADYLKHFQKQTVVLADDLRSIKATRERGRFPKVTKPIYRGTF